MAAVKEPPFEPRTQPHAVNSHQSSTAPLPPRAATLGEALLCDLESFVGGTPADPSGRPHRLHILV